jgi:hypothetical protein
MTKISDPIIAYTNMMFLPESKWSPRYESQFYTIRMNSYVTLDKPPQEEEEDAVGQNNTFGNDNDDICTLFKLCNILNDTPNKTFPAVYYKIEVLRGNSSHTILRRYSQFVYLHHKIFDTIIIQNTKHISKLPPKTGLFYNTTNNTNNEEFLYERMEGLYKFLVGLLMQPECVSNKWIMAFLELDRC